MCHSTARDHRTHSWVGVQHSKRQTVCGTGRGRAMCRLEPGLLQGVRGRDFRRESDEIPVGEVKKPSLMNEYTAVVLEKHDFQMQHRFVTALVRCHRNLTLVSVKSSMLKLVSLYFISDLKNLQMALRISCNFSATESECRRRSHSGTVACYTEPRWFPPAVFGGP